MANFGEGSSSRARRNSRKEPKNPSLLYNQEHHRSSQTTVNADRTLGLDKDIRIRGGKLCANWALDPRTEGILKTAGFYEAGKASGVNTDTTFLDCIMERWRGETHSFHLPRGEMTITLEDVSMILGLPADGLPITDVHHAMGPSDTPIKERVLDECQRLLGVRPQDGRNDGLKSNTHEIYLSWLHANFSGAEDPGCDVVAQRKARAYILALFGSCLFPTTSGNVVSPYYIYYLDDLEGCNAYSWASAVLAHTYSGLCKGVRAGAKLVAICRPLLMVWCYEHLPVAVPKVLNNNLPVDTSAALRWIGNMSWKFAVKSSNPTIYKDQLKSLRTDDITWNPWTPDRTALMPAVCHGAWRLKLIVLPLIHMNEVEWYLPDRVQRQFGRPQDIPKEHSTREAWASLHHKCKEWTKATVWYSEHEAFISMWAHRADFPVPNPMVGVSEHAYMKWYLVFTVTLVTWPTQTVERQAGQSSGYYNPAGNANSLIVSN